MPARSAVNQLPQEVKAELDEWLIHKGFAGYQELSEWLAGKGFSISKSSLHRYGSQFEQRIDALKIATEQAKAITAASPDDEGAMNDALQRLVQEKLFSVLLDLDVEQVESVKLPQLARAIADLGRASVNQKKWQAEVAQKSKAAADKAAAIAQKGGLSAEAAEEIKKDILGIGA